MLRGGQPPSTVLDTAAMARPRVLVVWTSEDGLRQHGDNEREQRQDRREDDPGPSLKDDGPIPPSGDGVSMDGYPSCALEAEARI